MTGARPVAILRQLDDAAATDRELLGRFAHERDQAAFADLVVRHGPLVLGVCLRIARQRQDAEDAFQAVFLTLASKAGGVGNPDLLGNWLHGVAVRVALRARRAANRRLKREVAVSVVPERSDSPAVVDSELAGVIDEELAGLPAWYRDAVLLCDLQELSRPKAARLIGIPEGTLSSRLAAGRKRLAERMARRGFSPAVAAIAVALAQTATAVSPALLAKTWKLVADYLAGVAVSRPVAKLSDGGTTVRQTLLLGLLTTAVTVAGVVYAAQPGQPEPPVTAPPKPMAQGKPAPIQQPEAKPGNNAARFTSDPQLAEVRDLRFNSVANAMWDPKGTLLAVAGEVPVMDEGGKEIAKEVRMDVEVIGPGSKLYSVASGVPEHIALDGFTPDGRQLLTVRREYEFVSGIHELDFWAIKRSPPSDVDFYGWNRRVKLSSAETHGYAFAPDEKTFRTVAVERDSKTQELKKVTVVEVDERTGKWLKSLLTAEASTFALSSDGKRLAIIEETDVVDVYDVDRGEKLGSHTLPPEGRKPANPNRPRPTAPAALVFSPDGHRLLAYRGLSNTFRLSSQGGDYTTIRFGPLGQVIVLNADTGKPLPALEGVEVLEIRPAVQSFTGNGRLLALAGTHYDPVSPDIVRAIEKSTSLRGVVVTSLPKPFLTVWDTETGKVVKTWGASVRSENIHVAFNPAKPVLAVMEPKRSSGTRLGMWDFAADASGK